MESLTWDHWSERAALLRGNNCVIAHLGTVQPHVGTVQTHLGTVQPHLGTGLASVQPDPGAHTGGVQPQLSPSPPRARASVQATYSQDAAEKGLALAGRLPSGLLKVYNLLALT